MNTRASRTCQVDRVWKSRGRGREREKDVPSPVEWCGGLVWERWGAGISSVRVGFCWKRQLLQWDTQKEKAALRLRALWGAAEEPAPRWWLGRLPPAQF